MPESVAAMPDEVERITERSAAIMGKAAAVPD